MLPRLRFIQLGDIHLPSSAVRAAPIDVKDPNFPASLKNAISSTPLKAVFKYIYRTLSGSRIDAVFCTGDFTDFGDLNGYKACCRYLANAFQLGSRGAFSSIPLGIVPGNHDVNRELAQAPGSTAKFAPLSHALAESGLPALPVETPIAFTIRRDASVANALLINSCWGCGEAEFIPELFRKPIAAAIQGTLQGKDSGEALETYYYRQLDTPAITIETISDVVNRIGAMSPTIVPVLVAHHNLLPQRIPRLAPYTELVNSGAFRSSLLELRRPVLYLHGHVHDDPIEVVQTPTGGLLVSVSAPEAVKGFNLLEILFTRHGVPLSCHVIRWRFDDSGVLRQYPNLSVPLISTHRRSLDPLLPRLYARLIERGESYWQDLLPLASSVPQSESNLAEMLELLLADGTISVENYDLPVNQWIIRASL